MEMPPEIATYNESKAPDRRAVCERLYQEICTGLPDAENKLWHGAPAWFLAGNPIVGYHSLKKGTRLFFWSGQSFGEPGLTNEGTFKAAGAMYSSVEEIDHANVQRWLAQSREIQWDYKNLSKNRKLVRVQGSSGY